MQAAWVWSSQPWGPAGALALGARGSEAVEDEEEVANDAGNGTMLRPW